MRIAHQIAQSNIDIQGNPSINYANFRRGSSTRGRGQSFNGRRGHENSTRGREGSGKEENKVICQTYGHAGHVTTRCYHRFDITFQGSQQSTGSSGSGGSNGYHQQASQNLHQAYVNQADVASSPSRANSHDD